MGVVISASIFKPMARPQRVVGTSHSTSSNSSSSSSSLGSGRARGKRKALAFKGVNAEFAWLKQKQRQQQELESFLSSINNRLDSTNLTLVPTIRLDIQHFLFKYAFRKQSLAPCSFKQFGQVLEVGQGASMAWLNEMAQTYPSVKFVGWFAQSPLTTTTPTTTTTTNSSSSTPLSSDHYKLPNNVELVISDYLNEFPFDPGQFDYIHQSNLTSAAPFSAYSNLFQQYYRLLKPGGVLEMADLLPIHQRIHNSGVLLNFWQCKLLEAQSRVNVEAAHLNLGELLQEAGFTSKHISVHTVSLPTGDWGGEVGMLAFKEFAIGMKAARQELSRVLGTEVSEELINVALDKFEIEASDVQSYRDMQVWIVVK